MEDILIILTDAPLSTRSFKGLGESDVLIPINGKYFFDGLVVILYVFNIFLFFCSSIGDVETSLGLDVVERIGTVGNADTVDKEGTVDKADTADTVDALGTVD
ncbi:hypothetical protein F3G14_19255, partial [Acinetobacter baumannii]